MPRARLLVAALLLALAATASPAAASDLRPRWVDADFLDGIPDEPGWDLWGWGTTSSGHDGRSMGTWLNRGEHGAAGGMIDLRRASGKGYIDQAFFRYWLYLDQDFYVLPPNRGKLPGLAALNGTYRCLGGKQSTVSDPCWSARTIFSRTYPRYGEEGYPNGPDDKTLLGTYIYHLDVPSGYDPYGDVVMWDPEVATLDHGRWYCVEGSVRMNTPGRADGLVRGWVDGELALRRDDLRLRRTGESDLGVQTMWMDLYHGGKDPSAADNEVRIDSLAVGPQRIGCADGATHLGTFSDDDASQHEGDVEWLATNGITRGCDPRRPHLFCATSALTRGQLAIFLADALDLPAGRSTFADVTGPRASAAVAALADAGVVRGCGEDVYCPHEPVTRAQLAAMVRRLEGLEGVDLHLSDVPRGSVFARDVGAVVQAGLIDTCGTDRFCPTSPVTREVMADVVHSLATGGTGG